MILHILIKFSSRKIYTFLVSLELYLICNSLAERFIGDLHLIRIGFNIVCDVDMWTVVLINPCVWNVAPSGRYSNGEAHSQTPPTHFQRAQSHRFSLVEITVSTFNCFLCQSSKRLAFSFQSGPSLILFTNIYLILKSLFQIVAPNFTR